MSTAPAPVSPAGFDRLYGLELVEVSGHLARGRVVVRDELKQPDGSVHGAVHVALAESLASIATSRAIAADRKLAAPLSNQTSFLQPINRGVIHGVAVLKHRGRTTWVWEAEISDDHGALCAVIRTTIAVTELG